jgi:pimeloyl-ACP methyl ester carboxylesterase
MQNVLRGLSVFVAALLIAGVTACPVGAQKEDDPHYKPVKHVGDREFLVQAPEGSGIIHYFATGSLDGSTTATRALINITGLLRNSDEYEKTGEEAIAAAGAGADTILITPQFLAQIDVTGHSLPASTIRWDVQTWLDGLPAIGPAPISGFSVLDAIAKRLADRSRFPAIHEIVFVGHSAGGQMIQRYAVVGKAPDDLAASGIAIRFVVANPSSYLYFDSYRPVPSIEATCPKFNSWKYGMDNLPPYVTLDAATLEARYVKRRVTYLLGQLDTNPNHPVLDKSCMGETEGPYRLARGLSFAQYLRTRHPSGTNQDVAQVADVDHDAHGMFTSTCGVAVIFQRPRTGCAVNAKI